MDHRSNEFRGSHHNHRHNHYSTNNRPRHRPDQSQTRSEQSQNHHSNPCHWQSNNGDYRGRSQSRYTSTRDTSNKRSRPDRSNSSHSYRSEDGRSVDNQQHRKYLLPTPNAHIKFTDNHRVNPFDGRTRSDNPTGQSTSNERHDYDTQAAKRARRDDRETRLDAGNRNDWPESGKFDAMQQHTDRYSNSTGDHSSTTGDRQRDKPADNSMNPICRSNEDPKCGSPKPASESVAVELPAAVKTRKPVPVAIKASLDKAVRCSKPAANAPGSDATTQPDSKLIDRLIRMDKHNLKQMINNPSSKFASALQTEARRKAREEMRLTLQTIRSQECEPDLEPDMCVNESDLPPELSEQIRLALAGDEQPTCSATNDGGPDGLDLQRLLDAADADDRQFDASGIQQSSCAPAEVAAAECTDGNVDRTASEQSTSAPEKFPLHLWMQTNALRKFNNLPYVYRQSAINSTHENRRLMLSYMGQVVRDRLLAGAFRNLPKKTVELFRESHRLSQRKRSASQALASDGQPTDCAADGLNLQRLLDAADAEADDRQLDASGHQNSCASDEATEPGDANADCDQPATECTDASLEGDGFKINRAMWMQIKHLRHAKALPHEHLRQAVKAMHEDRMVILSHMGKRLLKRLLAGQIPNISKNTVEKYRKSFRELVKLMQTKAEKKNKTKSVRKVVKPFRGMEKLVNAQSDGIVVTSAADSIADGTEVQPAKPTDDLDFIPLVKASVHQYFDEDELGEIADGDVLAMCESDLSGAEEPSCPTNDWGFVPLEERTAGDYVALEMPESTTDNVEEAAAPILEPSASVNAVAVETGDPPEPSADSTTLEPEASMAVPSPADSGNEKPDVRRSMAVPDSAQPVSLAEFVECDDGRMVQRLPGSSAELRQTLRQVPKHIRNAISKRLKELHSSEQRAGRRRSSGSWSPGDEDVIDVTPAIASVDLTALDDADDSLPPPVDANDTAAEQRNDIYCQKLRKTRKSAAMADEAIDSADDLEAEIVVPTAKAKSKRSAIAKTPRRGREVTKTTPVDAPDQRTDSVVVMQRVKEIDSLLAGAQKQKMRLDERMARLQEQIGRLQEKRSKIEDKQLKWHEEHAALLVSLIQTTGDGKS